MSKRQELLTGAFPTISIFKRKTDGEGDVARGKESKRRSYTGMNIGTKQKKQVKIKVET